MKKILLVNSLASSLALEKSLLNRADFRIFTAVSAEEALQIHRQEKVHLVIAELDLPQMGGALLCTALRNEGGVRAVSIVLVCSDNPDDLERVSRCGASGWMLKPLRPE